MDPTSGLAAEPTPTESAAIDRASGRLVAWDGGGRGEPAAGTGRWIDPWGTTTRLVAGAAGVTWGLAVPHQHPLLDLPLAGSRPWGALAGIVVLPALTTVLMALRGRSAPPLRLGHGAACLVTGGVVVLVQVFPVAILTWIGSTLLVLAALGRGGCEVLAAPNLLLRRRDYLACLPFTPIDEWESRRAGRAVTPPQAPAEAGGVADDRRYGCCGTPTPGPRLLSLTEHPEVEVCLTCADHLALRARERRDRLRPSLGVRGRGLLRSGRRLVVNHGWHHLPVVGRVLRAVGRFTP